MCKLLDSMMHVIGYNDHPDGNAYKAEEHEVEIGYTFTTALDVLTRCDNVCIIDNEHYTERAIADFMSIAPFAICMSLGQYAKPTQHPKFCYADTDSAHLNVNKL